MTTLKDREQAEEAKFAHDEQTRFLVTARRDKLFARWAGARGGVGPDTTDRLTHDLLALPGGANRDDRVLHSVDDFLRGHGRGLELSELTLALKRCLEEAHAVLG